jgi:hypothetical protein
MEKSSGDEKYFGASGSFVGDAPFIPSPLKGEG